MTELFTWPAMMATNTPVNIPLGLGAVNDSTLPSLDTTADVVEGIQQRELHICIERKCVSYLIEEAGEFHEWDGLGTLERAIGALARNNYAEVPDEGPPAALWIFNPATAQAIGDAIDTIAYRPMRTVRGYPFLQTEHLDEDRFIFVDPLALAENPASGRLDTPGYGSGDPEHIAVPRPWLVKDPHGVAVVEGVPPAEEIGLD